MKKWQIGVIVAVGLLIIGYFTFGVTDEFYDLGELGHAQYDIWGDTVNTAARMESSGDTGKINISQATYDLLKENPNYKFESRGKIEAKGKGAIEMYFAEQI